MLFQYFINYNLKKGWYITMQPILTANWKATTANVWTVPFGGGMLQIAFLFPKLPAKEKMLLMEEKLKEMQQQQTPHN